MIDHLAARRSLATAVDFSLPDGDADALTNHLRTCSACRSFDAALRVDAATLRGLEFGPVPASVRAKVAAAADRPARGDGLGRWIVLVGVGALLLAALGGGALGVGSRPTAGLGANQLPIQWHTQVVDFAATSLRIEADGQAFVLGSGASPVDVQSDPGNATSRTLEATWREHGVEMRLSLYFDGDAASSWVREIRIYDGRPQPDWVTWTGEWFRAPVGVTWTGDLDLSAPAGSLHIAGLVLSSTAFDGIEEPIAGGIILPVNSRPFAVGEPLHCSGILQLSPKDAEAVLLGLGYRLGWRLDTTTGPNTGYAEPMKTAPAGVIHQEPVAGVDGELVIFVAPFGDPKATPLPFPADCPPLPASDAVVPAPTQAP
jgi:hypothetical protein